MENVSQRNAYVIITDLHLNFSNKDNRIDFHGENNLVLNQLESIINKYKTSGHHVILLFLGDVFDRSIRSSFNAIYTKDRLTQLIELADECFVNMGNHEYTYYIDNPFWTLFHDIESQNVRSIKGRTIQPVGVTNQIRIVDTLVDGDVNIFFNHNRCDTFIPTNNKFNVGLFHKDYLLRGIKTYSQNIGIDYWDEKTTFLDNSALITNYDICFFGHVHKIYGNWTYKSDVVEDSKNVNVFYLSNLVRVAQDEVRDDLLERNVPVMIVDNGKYIRVEDNKFMLPTRVQSVKENVVQLQQEKYEIKKAKDAIKSNIPFSDDPINNIKSDLAGETFILDVFLELFENNYSSIGNELDILCRAEGI